MLLREVDCKPHTGLQFHLGHGEKKQKRFFTVEVLSGAKDWENAFKVPMKEAEEGQFDILFELDIESNSEFEFHSHLILFFALYGVAKLPEDEYQFMTSAGPILVRALAHYRLAEGYVVERLNSMVTKHFNGLTVWKQTPNHPLRDDWYKMHLLEINDK